MPTIVALVFRQKLISLILFNKYGQDAVTSNWNGTNGLIDWKRFVRLMSSLTFSRKFVNSESCFSMLVPNSFCNSRTDLTPSRRWINFAAFS